MFILVLFGYKQSRIFTIDCLTATLTDCIWQNCIKDTNKNILQKEEQHNKEKNLLQKKIQKIEVKIEQIDKLIKDEEEKIDSNDKKKQEEKNKKVAKKGKDTVPSNPLEIEKQENQKELEKIKENIQKYDDKLEKLKIQKQKFQELEKNENIIVELFDKTGERKFIKTKNDTIANTFLTDKNTYILGYYLPTKEEEIVNVVEIDGYCLRSIEEDEG
ncbi:hypothetical protein IMG5_076690 [Ichthyophthirius multifiliis]|uniref:Uncharacterized protein n=1 Tax=Ichthyophthirius multifiliis TaxID=5932 RepID=G0QQ79_ICHMU|nr:hypothetical protein IMG5_076690 [Ichthyophthirius multifiliis]EGR32639.1 hypothetical protein IMG5_076690 [Ichthyophthirius multifiliis]|eukprot:XP_004036625.1 hypothetical protein IMG5_076690 [Ichthyophthirius multifiliis]